MVLKTFICWIVLGLSLSAFAENIVIDGLIVVPIDRIDVPARATGLLEALNVREGASVIQGQLLASLDDEQAALEAERAKTQLQISEQLASGSVELELARKTAERTEQVAREQLIAREIAHRKAANDIRIRAAEKAEAVSSNELSRASEARKAFVDSVSRSEIDGLTLAFQRSQLETKQAIFEREMEALLAQSEDQSSLEQKLAIEQSRLGIKKAMADQSIATLKSQAAARDAEVARLVVNQHHLITPIDGVVVKILRRPGQWVQIGEPVVEVLRLSRLRAEGFVDQAIASKLRALPKVRINAVGSTTNERPGEIVFVMPEVDPVNGEVRFWIEFDNPTHDVLPGTQVSITVEP